MTRRSRDASAARVRAVPQIPDRRRSRVSASEQPLEILVSTMERASARRARAALGWMLPEGGVLTELSQVELQEFLWYELPKRWMVGTTEMHAVATALADLFTAAGLERYAALCRAPQTHQMLDGWQESNQALARKRMKQAIAVSGVDPPDTPALSWGAVWGVAELSASRRVSQTLEQAIEAGQLVPCTRGWRQRAASITETSLTLPRLDLRGGSLLTAVHRERVERWAAGNPAARREILTPIRRLLEGELVIPTEAEDSLLPMRWLLERIGDGATLTAAGWLPRALVLEANDAFGWFDLFDSTVRSENDLPELAALNELAGHARLTIRSRNKLTLTAMGRAALRDSGMLWRAVLAQMFLSSTYEGEGAALLTAMLVNARGPLVRQGVVTTVGAAMEGRWRLASGKALDQWSGVDATAGFTLLAEVFGWLETEHEWDNRTWRLSSPGRKAALLGLQIQARTPQNRV